MKNTFTLSGKHSSKEIRPVISEALKREADFAHTRFAGFEKECRAYEAGYGLGGVSEEVRVRGTGR